MRKLFIISVVTCISQTLTALNNAGTLLTSHNGRLNLPQDTSSKSEIAIKPFNLDIVAPSSGIQFYRNGIIFLSFSKGDERIPEKHLSFGTLKTFMALVSDTLPGQYMPFLTTSSVIFPSEATTFSPDFNTMYLSLIPEKGDREKIFRATYSQKGWVFDNEPLNICQGNFIYTHPCLSADGSFMIFSSDKSESSGGLDLFVSRKTNDSWGTAENLGKHINTSGNEIFASLDANNNLYFSSDGLQGKGGYDVYVCRFDGTGWEKPVNLSEKFNTKDDELAFTINRTDGGSAFYTSRTRSGKTRMQLYRVTPGNLTAPGVKHLLSEHLLAIAGIQERPEPAKSLVAEKAPVTALEKDKQMAKTGDKSDLVAPSRPPIETQEATKAKTPETPVTSQPESKKIDLVYRVQILANTKPVGSYDITIAGRSYKTYEYLYKGGYRTTVGEFSTLSEATRFQNECRQNGYSNAFIAAFSDNKRITDAEAKELEAQLSQGPRNMPATDIQRQNQPAEARPEASPATTKQTQNGEVIYRVQILANTKPVGSYNLTVAGQNYRTYEYLYMGGYRTTIGEFKTFSEAVRFQSTCRKAGYDQAFVVAFKNNVRTNDPALLR